MFDFRKNQFLQALLIIAVCWLLYLVRSVLVVVFIAFLFTIALRPIVDWLAHHRVPKPLAVLAPVVVIGALVSLVGFLVVPTLITEVTRFANELPTYLQKIQTSGIVPASNFNLESVRTFFENHVSSLSRTLLGLTTTLANIVIGAVAIFVVTLYWVASYTPIKNTLATYVPKEQRARALDIWARTEKKLGSWVLAQVLLSIAVGLLVWLGAALIGLPFAGLLGLIAGLLEVIPTLGPLIAAVPGILLGLTVSPRTALFALILYIVVQQLENHVLAPLLVGRTVHLHPIIIIVSLLVGAALAGIIGALLAVPVALCISSFVDSYREGALKKISKRHALS